MNFDIRCLNVWYSDGYCMSGIQILSVMTIEGTNPLNKLFNVKSRFESFTIFKITFSVYLNAFVYQAGLPDA